jgi:hypothetical protein
VLQGGRNFGQKAQKGPGEIKLARRICGLILLKGAEENFANEVPYLTVLTHLQRQRKTLV